MLVTLNEQSIVLPIMPQWTIVLYKAICQYRYFTWTGDFREHTTLLEATKLLRALRVQLVTLLYLYIFLVTYNK